MNPGAGWGAKQWPAERYGEVAKALAAMGYCVVVNTGTFGRISGKGSSSCQWTHRDDGRVQREPVDFAHAAVSLMSRG